MTDRDRLERILTELNLPVGRWALAGSGVMVLHGINRKMRDVDIFCATQTWFSLFRQQRGQGLGTVPMWDLFVTDPDDVKRRCDPPYLYREMHGIEVNVFSAWRLRVFAETGQTSTRHSGSTTLGWLRAGRVFRWKCCWPGRWHMGAARMWKT